MSDEGEETRWLLMGCGSAVAGVVLVGLLGLGAIGLSFWWAQPERAPEVTYRWTPPSSPEGIDWRELHMEGWREWVLREEGWYDERLLRRLQADAAAGLIAGALLAAAEQGDLVEVDVQVDLWNAAMKARGVPWALRSGQYAGRIYVKVYHVLALPEVTLGGRTAPIAWGIRADRTNVVEGWLGSADDIGDALLVMDRVADFTYDSVWPLLGSSESPSASAIAQWVHRPGLVEPTALEVLARTAAARAAMLEAERTLTRRNLACQGTFRLRFSWDGLNELGELRTWALRERGADCPGILAAEVDALVEGTLAIRQEPLLPQALEQLVAAVARHTMVHEARHTLDHEDWGYGTEPPCEACPVDGPARIEASAYLSSFATEEAPVALLQACQVLGEDPDSRAGRAIWAVLSSLEQDCDAEIRPDLQARAAALARIWFSREEGAVFSDTVPHSVPLRVSPVGPGP